MTHHGQRNQVYAVLLAVLTLTSAIAGVAVLGGTVFAESGVHVVDDDGGQDYETIGAAIANATAGDTIEVNAGTYSEQVTIDKSLTLRGAQAGVDAVGRSASGSETHLTGSIVVTSSDVTIDGFEISNPDGANGIRVDSANNVTITNNRVENVGTGSFTGPAAQAIYLLGSTDDAEVTSNAITNVGNADATATNKGIYVGDSNSGIADGVVISGNAISEIHANAAAYVDGGRGAYGVLVNHEVTGLEVSANTISSLDGLWVHAIGLEGPTPDATVTGNAISDLEATKGDTVETGAFRDEVGVFFEANPSASSVSLGGNSYENLAYGVLPHPTTQDASVGTIVVVDGPIQGAVNASSDGDTIEVGEGTFTEQVVVDENVTLVGAGEGQTVIESPATLTKKFTDARGDNYPVVFVENADADVRSLTVDGANQGGNNHHFYGIVYRNANGTVADVTVSNVRESPISGTQHGVAVAVMNIDGQNRTVTLRDSSLVDYQKNGYYATGEGLTAQVIGNDVTGAGPTDVIGQNGIQIGGSATGVIEDNVVSGHQYTPQSANGSAIYLYPFGNGGQEPATVTNNTVTNNDNGVAVGSSPSKSWAPDPFPAVAVSITGNQFEKNTKHVYDAAEKNLDATALFENNDFDTAAYVSTEGDAVGEHVYSGIQAAVDAADDGDTITVGPGTYTEQVYVDENVTLVGAGEGQTIIESPATLTESFTKLNGGEGYPVVLVENVNVDIQDLTVDGANQGNGNGDFFGVTYANASGTVENVTVRNVMESPFSGSQHGIAVSVVNADGEDRTFTLRDSTLVDYQKGGFVGRGAGLTAHLVGNDVTGAGPTDVIGQNGIQIDQSAVAIIENNTVSGHVHTGGAGTADIILYGLSSATTSVVENNTIGDSTIGLAVGSTNITIENNEFSNNTYHVADYIGSLDTAAVFDANTFTDAAYADDGNGAVGRSIYGSIQMAIDEANSGDTVIVAPGTYDDALNVTNATGITVKAVGDGEALIEPTEMVKWDVGDSGVDSREVAVRVFDSEHVVFDGLTFDFGQVKDPGKKFAGILYWNSTGTLENNTIRNTSTSGHYEQTVVFQAPGYTNESRAFALIANNTFENTGRQGVATHDYVDALIKDNEFHSADDDSGYAIELGSMSTGSIVRNEIHGYGNEFPSDGSDVAGIYIENSFTTGVDGQMRKEVVVAENDIYDNQIGIQFGQTWDTLSANVSIDAHLVENYIHDNVAAGVNIVDENAENGSSVTVQAFENTIENNGEVGYHVFTNGEGQWHVGDGDINVSVYGDTITGHGTGIKVEDGGDSSDSTIDVTVRNSDLSSNEVGINNTWIEPIDATFNYWGSADGPNATTNTYNVDSQGVDALGDVQFAPWLVGPPSTSPSVVMPVTNVDTQESYASIQDAVTASNDGDTIVVAPGVYDESVTIDTKNITLQSTAGAESTKISADARVGVMIKTSGVTVRGFTVTTNLDDTGSYGQYGIRVQPSGHVENILIEENIVEDISDTYRPSGISLDLKTTADETATDVTIRNNIVQNITSVESEAYDALAKGINPNERFDRLTIDNNTIRNIGNEHSAGAIAIDLSSDTNVAPHRGPQNFTITRNDIDGITVDNESYSEAYLDALALYLHEYGTLGDEHVVTQNAFRDGDVLYNTEGVTNPDELNAPLNYWGAANGPGGVASGDGVNVTENVTFRPFYTNAAMTEDSTAPPEISDATLTDVTDGDGTVGDGDTVRVSANVTDISGIKTVIVDARPFGGNEFLELTHQEGDQYEAEFEVDASSAHVDAGYALTVTAVDNGNAANTASTTALTLATDSETRTWFTISDKNPLNTEIVEVTVTVANLGDRSADRTITLLVDGEDERSRDVTVPASQDRTITFEYRFSAGEHDVKVNDSIFTTFPQIVNAERASNPDANVEIISPTAGQSFASGDVTVTYGLTDAAEGIAKVAYTVDDGAVQSVTDLSQSSIALSGLSDGSHTVDLWLVDNLGNQLSGDSITFAVDSSAPVVTVDPARTDAIGANRSVDIDFGVSDANPGEATFLVRDGNTVVYSEDISDELADGEATITWDGTDDAGDVLATGNYDVVLNATDEVGLSNETTATVSVDNTPPTATVGDQSTLHVGSDGSVTVDVTADDADGVDSGVSSVSVMLDSIAGNFRTTADATNNSGTWQATFDAENLSLDGNYTVVATATDAANNVGSVTGPDEIAVDTTAPSVSAIIDTKEAGIGYVNVTVADEVADENAIGLNLTAPDGSDVTVIHFSQVGSTNTYSGTFGFTDGGEYSLEANATDAAGNLGESNATANISVLEAKSQHTIAGADGTQVVLNMKNDAGGIAAFTSSNSPLAELGTNVGSTFLNGELNESLTDNLKNATIRIPVAGNVPAGADKNGINISRYNETEKEWDLLPTEIEVDEDGTEYFVTTVTHFSTYGPVNPDTTAPTIEAPVLVPDDDPLAYNTDEVDVTVEYSDNKQVDASNVTVLWNGADVTGSVDTSVSASEMTFTATGLVGSGDHNVTVVVVDTAGNENSEEVLFTVEQDTVAPSVTLVDDTFDYGTDPVPLELTYTDALSGVNTSSVEFKVDGTDKTGLAVVTSSGVTYNAAGLGPGNYPVALNATDNEGNPVSVTETFTIEGDGDQPTVTSQTPADGDVLALGTSQTTITLSYGDDTSGINTSAIEVKFEGVDVTDEAVITSSGLTYTAIDLQNGISYTLEATIEDNENNSWTETVAFEVASPPSADSSNSGSSPVRDRPTDRLSRFLNNGETAFEVGTTLSHFGIDFTDRDASGTVSVQSLDERPTSVAAIADATEIAFVDVSVPGSLTNSEASLRLTVDADAIGDASPSSLVVYHYKNGAWTALETSVVSTSDEEIVLRATTPGFSLFAVGSVQEETTTEPGTETPDPETETPEPETETPGPDTSTPEPATETDEPVQEPGGFGFGTTMIVLLVVGIVIVVYVVRTRRA